MSNLSTAANKNAYNEFRIRGTHHVNQYGLQINVPQNVVNMLKAQTYYNITANDITERLNYYCTEVLIPQMSIDSTPIRVGGEKIEIPYDRSYGEFQTTFYIDNGNVDDGGLAVNAILAWFDLVYPPNHRTFSYMDDYKTTITVYLTTYRTANVNDPDEDIVTITLVDAWPSSIQGIQLSGRGSNEPSSFIISWKYRYSVFGSVNPDGWNNEQRLNQIDNVVSNLSYARTFRTQSQQQAASTGAGETNNTSRYQNLISYRV